MPTLEILQECFKYENGFLYRKKSDGGRSIGSSVGSDNGKGYLVTSIKPYGVYCVHRIIWMLAHGADPDYMTVDHINKDTRDNRIENLRLVSPSHSNFNRGIRADNKSGYKGVSYDEGTGKWVAHIQFEYKKYKKSFEFKNEAIAARSKAEAFLKKGNLQKNEKGRLKDVFN